MRRRRGGGEEQRRANVDLLDDVVALDDDEGVVLLGLEDAELLLALVVVHRGHAADDQHRTDDRHTVQPLHTELLFVCHLTHQRHLVQLERVLQDTGEDNAKGPARAVGEGVGVERCIQANKRNWSEFSLFRRAAAPLQG